ADRLGTDVEDVEAVLQVMQTFEPTGICARNLKECLALQLAERDRLDPTMQVFLDHLELFAKRDFEQLMKLTGADREDIASMVDDIRLCDPKPGHAFGAEPVVPVVPDVFIRPRADGSWMVEINSETLPRVLVNQQYYAEVTKLSGDPNAKAYISECLNNANWLVKSLDQRARTILKVASEIVRQQDSFLVHGIQHLKPLNLKTIAEAISMHESTVSRVTANKYIATPRGIFEMKYFFTSSIASSSGGAAHSAESVRHRIKELIDVERADAVLSDDNIVDILKGQGVDIARRTVAKYREALNIPSSVQRRREKKAYA
ncbi:MAG: RNA polymerase factor sigma-54, partial [Parvibaculum sp.]